MIESAEEFVRLRVSEVPADYHSAAHDEAAEHTWLEIIRRFPEMRVWVAHNKTVPLAVLEILRNDDDEHVRSMVRRRRSWARAHPDDTSRPQGLENSRTRNRRMRATGPAGGDE